MVHPQDPHVRTSSLVVHQNPIRDETRGSRDFEVRGRPAIEPNGRHAGVHPGCIRHQSKVLVRCDFRKPIHERDQTLSRQLPWVPLTDVMHQRSVQSPVGSSGRTTRSAPATHVRVDRPQRLCLVRNNVSAVDLRSWRKFQPFLFSVRYETDFLAERAHGLLAS